jgi:hypothetical protein
MKVAIKIMAYSIWFGFILWLSIYGGGGFSGLVSLMEKRIIRTEISPDYEVEINWVLWNGLICLLLWIPILFTKKWRTDAARTIGRDMTFLILLVGFTVAGAIYWQIYFSEDMVPTSLFISEPDRSDFKLWCLWWAFIIGSNAISAAMTFSIWRPQNRTPPAP